ncbi:MAG: segregation/condensation protein A [Candidatus Nanoarchaeia archaeon]|jgi:segregation and condensation protein A
MENDKIYDLMTSDKLTWEGLIRDIVREEEMDPWDINISKLALRFAEAIRKVNNINFRMTGKFILTASFLLKLKSDFLLVRKKTEAPIEGLNLAWLFKEINYNVGPTELTPRIPMKKKRRVTLDELIDALRKAIEVNDRRSVRHIERDESRIIHLNIKKIDLKEKIAEVYDVITDFFKRLKKKEIRFEELLPSKEKFDIVWTFIPLLYLSNKGKIDLYQERTFSDIIVKKP